MHFFIPAGIDLEAGLQEIWTANGMIRNICAPFSTLNKGKRLLDVRNIMLTKEIFGPCGYEAYRPVSIISTLASGEDCFVYRFLLFWDCFQTLSGCSASGEGFCLIAINPSLAVYSSPNAGRVVTLVPQVKMETKCFARFWGAQSGE